MSIRNKIKKLAAVAMAGVMAGVLGFSMAGTTTKADETTPITGLTIEKVFESDSGGITPNETFTFTMTPDTSVKDGQKDTASGLSVYKGVDLGANATVKMVYTSLSDKTQKATFSLEGVKFSNKPAIYRYLVKEVKPANANQYITYDSTVFKVDVTVDANGNILSVINVTNSENVSEKQPIVFNNKYTSDDLVIKKVVSGTLGNKSEAFKFKLNIPVEGIMITLQQYAPFKAYYEDASTGTKTYAGEIKVGEDFEFVLSDGDQLLVENVPAGMIYTVTETGAQDYTTNITCTSANTESGTAKKLYNQKEYNAYTNETPIIEGENLVTFENIKDYNADTGVRIDYKPYIILFLIAAVGVSVLIFRKKGKWTN